MCKKDVTSLLSDVFLCVTRLAPVAADESVTN